MGKITYTDKENAQTTQTATNQKVSAADMNAIKSSVNELFDVIGWGFYQSGSGGTQTITSTASYLQINGTGTATETSYLPTGLSDVSNLWDTTNHAITPEAVGDTYDLRLDLQVTAKTQSPSRLIVQLDIGGNTSEPTIVINRRAITLDVIPETFSIGFPIFCLSTFKANGGRIFLSVDSGTITLGSRGIFLGRNYAQPL